MLFLARVWSKQPYSMRYRGKRDRKPGLFTEVDWEVALAVKKLAREMDVSASSLVNAILKKALANSGSTPSGDRE